MGLSVPAYFNGDSGAQTLEYIGNLFKNAETNELNPFFAAVRDVVAAIGKTGMAVAAVLGLLVGVAFLFLNVIGVRHRDWNVFISGAAAGMSLISMLENKFW